MAFEDDFSAALPELLSTLGEAATYYTQSDVGTSLTALLLEGGPTGWQIVLDESDVSSPSRDGYVVFTGQTTKWFVTDVENEAGTGTVVLDVRSNEAR